MHQSVGSVLIETTRVHLDFSPADYWKSFWGWKLWNLHNHGKPWPRCCGRTFPFSPEQRNINPKTHWNRNDGIKDKKKRFFFTHHHHEWRNPGGSPNVIFFSHLIWKKSILCFQFKSTDIYGKVLHQDSFPPQNIEMNAIIIFLCANLIQEGLCCFLCPHVEKILVHIEREPGNWTF